MQHSFTILLVTVLLLSSGCSRSSRASTDSSGQSASSIADDQQSLQGTWKMKNAMLNGQPMMDDVRWVFDGDSLTIVLGGNYAAGVHSHYQLGTGDSPNTILIKAFDNPLANQGYYGGTYTGIYKISGDKLRVCYDMTGRQYPKSFDAGRGSMRMTYEFTREKS
jgi:uncharacterized protein (TIGR03067 family)